jgi:hypothetical protein
MSVPPETPYDEICRRVESQSLALESLHRRIITVEDAIVTILALKKQEVTKENS